jgi:hypothetical protein
MGRMFSMWSGKDGPGTDLTERAKAHASAREGMIEVEIQHHMERTGMDYGQASQVVRATIDGARRRLKLAGGEQTPNLAEHGVAAPMMIGGEQFQAAEVEYRKGGDRVITAVRPLGGGRFETKKIRMMVEGGERTRVMA